MSDNNEFAHRLTLAITEYGMGREFGIANMREKMECGHPAACAPDNEYCSWCQSDAKIRQEAWAEAQRAANCGHPRACWNIPVTRLEADGEFANPHYSLDEVVAYKCAWCKSDARKDAEIAAARSVCAAAYQYVGATEDPPVQLLDGLSAVSNGRVATTKDNTEVAGLKDDIGYLLSFGSHNSWNEASGCYEYDCCDKDMDAEGEHAEDCRWGKIEARAALAESEGGDGEG